MSRPESPWHRLGREAYSKEEHDELMETRDRPVTQTPIRRRRDVPDEAPPSSKSTVDNYIQQVLRKGQR
jgi:hypothetical protein